MLLYVIFYCTWDQPKAWVQTLLTVILIKETTAGFGIWLCSMGCGVF